MVAFILVPIGQEAQRRFVGRSGFGGVDDEDLIGVARWVERGARRTERLEALVGRIEAAGGTASFRRLDVTDAADVQRFVTDATNTYGGVDVMINNAGVMPLSALAEDKVDEWNRMIDVNIRGVLHGISAAFP
jgi:NADP-dependent 3-hydroxy acid dehydrogenase YdfG